MDGTMFDTERIYSIYWAAVCKNHGYTITEDMISHLRGATRAYQKTVLEQWFGKDVPADAIISECMQSVSAHLDREPIPFKPGLIELLEALRERGIATAIGTGTRRVRADAILEKSGVRGYIDAVACSDEVPNGKPDPAVFLLAAQRIGLPPEDCFVLEDSFNGIRAAHAAGAHPIFIPDLDQPTAEIREMCDHVLTCLDDVIELL
jgi:HAD superfamily hydrolase (TIGR01509 family)